MQWGASATCPNCSYKGWMQVARMIWCPKCGYTKETGKPPEVRPGMIYKPSKVNDEDGQGQDQ